MKLIFAFMIGLLSIGAFGQETSFGKEYERKQFHQVYAQGLTVEGFELGKYDQVYMVDTGGLMLNFYGYILFPGGTFAADYSPQCGTGQQFWWEESGTWKLLPKNRMRMTIISLDLATMNYSAEEIKELEKLGPDNDRRGESYLYEFEILGDLYLCLTKIDD